MRLIDADLLLPQIGNRYDEKKDIVPDNLAEGFMQMDKFIREQPIAYDVDKVVTELQDKSFERYGNQGMGGELVISLDDAVEIVKRGGTDESK